MGRLLSSYFLALVISKILLFSQYCLLLQSADSSADDILYGVYNQCTPGNYSAGSPYESDLNSLFASIVNSAAISSYNNFTTAGSVSGQRSGYAAHGLYQCRGDLSLLDCAACVAGVVKKFAGICPQTTGGVIQVVGCLVKYDCTNFIGVENKTVAFKQCGRSDPAVANTVDAVLKGLSGPVGVTKLNAEYEVIGMSQCVGDLSVEMCEDCLGEAIQQLRTTCSGAVSGEMFLGKCYARYMIGQSRHEPHNKHVKRVIIIVLSVIASIVALVLLGFLIYYLYNWTLPLRLANRLKGIWNKGTK
ncbi:unnamed protein product [Cuscuta epithymum]|uniref:Gnk2-homologous domain-containing protein n=1 Tax=Cuscuta epithymum TaxID=186058 RepID=A0AAV0C9G1_9ASTE|nr:unnamed protein product [Cuscuta epithymum]